MRLLRCLISSLYLISISAKKSTNLILNGDAENGLNFWDWDNSTEIQFSTVGFSLINITDGGTAEAREKMGKFGFQTKLINNEKVLPSTFIVSQLIALPDYVFSGQENGFATFRFSGKFLRYFNNRDYTNLTLNFFNENNEKILFNSQDWLNQQFSDNYENCLEGNIQPFKVGANLGSAFYFSASSNGTVPSNAKNIKISMVFNVLDLPRTNPVMSAIVDNLELIIEYNNIHQITAADKMNSMGLSFYVGVSVGGLGAVCLLICVPCCFYFKKKQNPMPKKFLLKRRNSASTMRRNNLESIYSRSLERIRGRSSRGNQNSSQHSQHPIQQQHRSTHQKPASPLITPVQYRNRPNSPASLNSPSSHISTHHHTPHSGQVVSNYDHRHLHHNHYVNSQQQMHDTRYLNNTNYPSQQTSNLYSRSTVNSPHHARDIVNAPHPHHQPNIVNLPKLHNHHPQYSVSPVLRPLSPHSSSNSMYHSGPTRQILSPTPISHLGLMNETTFPQNTISTASDSSDGTTLDNGNNIRNSQSSGYSSHFKRCVNDTQPRDSLSSSHSLRSKDKRRTEAGIASDPSEIIKTSF